jgi:DNA binding domain, excisionase family
MSSIENNSIQRTYTVNEVAEILGVSLRTVYYLCESTKDFKVIRMGRRCIRIHKESFDKWLDRT